MYFRDILYILYTVVYTNALRCVFRGARCHQHAAMLNARTDTDPRRM